MSDNVTANPGSGGSVFASAGITFAGASAQLPQSSSGLLSGSSGSWTYTLLVGGAGTVTAGTQRVTLASDDPAVSQLSTLNGKITACNTGAVVVSSSALPSGAATAAKQPALGTAGTASTDVLTVQGIAGGTALPASQSGNWSVRAQDGSGNLLTSRVTGSSRPLEIAVLDGSGNQITSFGGSGGTASNVGSAVPSTATAGGWSDGTNMQLARVFDADSGAGTQYIAGVNLRLSSSGGSVEGGTASNPLRTDPTGTTTQPVSGTVTANVGTTNGIALDATLTGGSQKTKIVDSGGTNVATVSAAGAVKVDGSAVTQPISGTVTANIGTVGTLALESGGNLATVATNTTGLNNAVGTAASAIPSKVLVVGGSDGTNARALKLNTSGQADIRPLTSSDVVSAAQSGTWTVGLSAAQTLATVTTVSTVTSLSQWAGNAIDTNSGVKSAGTLRVVLATDQPALTTAMPVSQKAATSVSATLQSAAAANGNGSTLSVDGYSAVAWTISGTFSATVNFEGTEDGTNWTALSAVQLGTATIGSTATTTGTYECSVGGLTSIRARISGYVSGNVTVTVHAVPVNFAPRTIQVANTVAINQTQWAGTAVDTNSGTKSGGTLRVVLATDQPQLTNALKVDPSAVTSPVSLASVPTHAVNVAASATGSGASVYTAVSAAGNNSANVKSSAGQVLGLWAMNLNASPRYVKFFNKTSPTMGTDAAVAQVMIPGNTTGAGVVIQFPCPLPFSTAIAVAITGGISLTDNTSISANEVTLNIQYV